MQKPEAFAESHRILGSGKIPSCEKKVSEGCRQCCQHGSVLFEGENLKVVPDGVSVVGNRVRDCLGPTGCKFPDSDKPLVCKMYPAVRVGISTDATQEVFHQTAPDCPARLPRRFRDKVNTIVALLKRAGVWGERTAKLSPTSDADARKIIQDLRRMRT